VPEQQHKYLNDFFKEEYEALKGYVRSKIKHTSESDAEDIIQDVALRIFSRPPEALPITNIGGFVYHAVKNKIIDTMRTKKEEVRNEDKLEQLWTEFASLCYEVDTINYSDQLKTHLEKAIIALKPYHKDIILTIDFEGYTYREISTEIGISAGTLMSRRHRAIALLSKTSNLIKSHKIEHHGV
jgi:RNA polymerase sigma-70 factor (ECF subfamily)